MMIRMQNAIIYFSKIQACIIEQDFADLMCFDLIDDDHVRDERISTSKGSAKTTKSSDEPPNKGSAKPAKSSESKDSPYSGPIRRKYNQPRIYD